GVQLIHGAASACLSTPRSQELRLFRVPSANNEHEHEYEYEFATAVDSSGTHAFRAPVDSRRRPKTGSDIVRMPSEARLLTGSGDIRSLQTSMLLADVAVPVPLAHAFTYSVPEALASSVRPGARVLCEFGRRKLLGVVLSVGDHAAPDVNLKPI